MIKDLQEKTFKMNAEVQEDSSIIMKKRSQPFVVYEHGKPKIINNQLFDEEGNVLSRSNSRLLGSIHSRLGSSEFTQSGAHHGGPCGLLSPSGNFKKDPHDDQSVQPVSTSQGPCCRLKQTISPRQVHSNRSSSKGLASSRNSGFRPLKSLQNTEGQGFIRKPEYVGSLVSNASS